MRRKWPGNRTSVTISVPRRLCKEHDDQRDEHQRLQHFFGDRSVGGCACEGRLIEVDVSIDARRQIRELCDRRLYGIDHLDGVAARHAQDVQIDGVFTG